jgi:uncharacterized protein YbaA (DUF1428 family)
MPLHMAKSNGLEIEQMIGSEVDHFVARAPKKNHDAMVQLSKQFADIMRKYGVTNLYFQLNNTESPMEGITNIAKAISANPDEEVWLELLFYKDSKHREEVGAKMQNDERMGTLYQQSLSLLTPGTGFIIGEFNRVNM